jgi:hypothetical protein
MELIRMLYVKYLSDGRWVDGLGNDVTKVVEAYDAAGKPRPRRKRK